MRRRTGPRKRHLHAGIARALARRNNFPVACVHAASAEEPALLNEIVETVGVFGLWLRGGVALLVSTDRLAPGAVDAYLGIGLLRSAVLRFTGRIEEAQALFDVVERSFREGERGDGLAQRIDRVFARVMLDGGVCRQHVAILDRMPLGGEREGVPGDDRLAAARDILRCTAAHECARLEDSRRHGLAAIARFAPEARYGKVYASIFVGMTAMAKG